VVLAVAFLIALIPNIDVLIALFSVPAGR